MRFIATAITIPFSVLLMVQSGKTIYPEHRIPNRLLQFIEAVDNTLKIIIQQSKWIDSNNYNVTYICLTKCLSNCDYQNIEFRSDEYRIGEPLALFIHGWIDAGSDIWIRSLMKTYIEFIGGTICAVDWVKFSRIEYFLAMRNVPIVVEFVTRFLDKQISNGFDINQITLIGHSLGAQICGQVGSHFNGKLPRIFGLDPAGIGFTRPLDFGIGNRLDPTDAKFVQCIHTDKYLLGSSNVCGHQDFFPNDGSSPQPGCIWPVLHGGSDYVPFICSHFKSIDYFRSSLNLANEFIGTQCGNYSAYLDGKCDTKPQDRMGFHAIGKERGLFYLKTIAKDPYVQPKEIQ